MNRLLAALAIALPLVACKGDEEVEYEQFNADADSIEVEVGVESLLDPRVADINSSTGEVVIGSVEVDPGGGPVGTNHDVVVIINDDWEGEVDRVSVRTAPPDDDRVVAEDEYDLTQDSADEGYYKTTLESVGEPGEVRTDTFTIRVWRIVSDGTDGTDGTGGTGDG